MFSSVLNPTCADPPELPRNHSTIAPWSSATPQCFSRSVSFSQFLGLVDKGTRSRPCLRCGALEARAVAEVGAHRARVERAAEGRGLLHPYGGAAVRLLRTGRCGLARRVEAAHQHQVTDLAGGSLRSSSRMLYLVGEYSYIRADD